MYFLFNLPFAWSRFLKHERAKGGDALVEVARLKSDNIALKAFCLFVCFEGESEPGSTRRSQTGRQSGLAQALLD